ncbi:hypothetical protein [Oceanicella sp. SM1341]|uniref:hypothetical protein n=1 Tax=Oceanicella sp. SM1341 TaxID=1548889 RepID=UPI000E5052B7|nr:hypothetical protein [Oceanicella sp. SM1341]
MTTLSQIAKHVSQPEATDRLYVLDVSDTTEGPGGSSGYTTPGDLLAPVRYGFQTRALAQTTAVPAGANFISVAGLHYKVDNNGTALTTLDGRKWSPDGTATYEHWGATASDASDDTVALRAAHDWAMKNNVPLRPQAGVYRVSGTIIDYDVQRDGTNCSLNLVGDGIERTKIRVIGAPGDYLIKIVGDTSAYGLPHAKFFNIENLSIEGDGASTCDVFYIVCAGKVHLKRINVFNCRGYVVRALEWWDSEFDLSCTRCGDDGLGANSGSNGVQVRPAFQKPAVYFNYWFASAVANSACNNIYMPKTFQIESSRHTAMYWGPGTRKCALYGKIHGYPPQEIHFPHLIMDGARQNFIIGANLTECNGIAIRIINDNAYIPTENMIVGSYIDADSGNCVEINGGRRNIVVGNCFDTTGIAVNVLSGLDNVVHSNLNSGGAVVASATDLSALEPFHVLTDFEMTTAGAAVVLTAGNGTKHRLTVSNAGQLLINGTRV